MLLGAIPALVVGALYAAALVFLVVNLDHVVGWATPFADGWSAGWATTIRVLIGVAAIAAGAAVAVLTFSAVTLAVGDPFYERISQRVERDLGNGPTDDDTPFWRSVGRAVVDGIRLIAMTAAFGIVIFLLGFIPVVGQTVVPVLAALVGGWFLTVELTGYAFDARGRRLSARRRSLRAHTPETLGFGVLTYLLFLIPLVAVVATPAAVAGATMLARLALDEETPLSPGTVGTTRPEG
jgi:CysZ protein